MAPSLRSINFRNFIYLLLSRYERKPSTIRNNPSRPRAMRRTMPDCPPGGVRSAPVTGTSAVGVPVTTGAGKVATAVAEPAAVGETVATAVVVPAGVTVPVAVAVTVAVAVAAWAGLLASTGWTVVAKIRPVIRISALNRERNSLKFGDCLLNWLFN